MHLTKSKQSPHHAAAVRLRAPLSARADIHCVALLRFEVLATEQAAVPGSRAALAIQAAAAAGRGATDPEQAAAVVAARNATIARMSWRLQGRLGTFQKALESFDWRNTGAWVRLDSGSSLYC